MLTSADTREKNLVFAANGSSNDISLSHQKPQVLQETKKFTGHDISKASFSFWISPKYRVFCTT